MTKRTPHPGEIIYRDCVEPSGLTITEAASALGVTRPTLSELLNGHRGVSAEMAVRLEKGFIPRTFAVPSRWHIREYASCLAISYRVFRAAKRASIIP
jgi:addiction module HigA family antidote